jgi:hypothetical protein
MLRPFPERRGSMLHLDMARLSERRIPMVTESTREKCEACEFASCDGEQVIWDDRLVWCGCECHKTCNGTGRVPAEEK